MLDHLIKELIKFRKERDWEQFHTPKNLAESIVIEAAELLELFQWQSNSDADTLTDEQREEIHNEVADVVIFLLYLCHDLGIDIDDAVKKKIKRNASRYSVEKSKGNATKYNKLKT